MHRFLLQFVELFAGPSVSVTDRLRGVGRTFSSGGHSGATPWLLLLGGLFAILGIIGVFALAYLREQNKEMWASFWRNASRLGLGDEERNLLKNVALAAKVRNPQTVITSEEAFYRGLANVERSGQASSLFGGARQAVCGSCRFYHSLREKLGFAETPSLRAVPTDISLGPIEVGTALKIVRQRGPQDLDGVLADADEATGELTVRLKKASAVQLGESWMVRYADGGLLWEFNARVVRHDSDTEIDLRPGGDARCIDRRRFARVPVSRSAHIAHFPFQREDGVAEEPRFVPAQLLQLAGPGVLLRADFEADRDDRVLVVLELSGKAIEGIARVRRGNKDAEPGSPLAIELVGLDTAQIADLARQTSTAAHQIRHSSPDQSPAPITRPAEGRR
jgi:hypothetical protein